MGKFTLEKRRQNGRAPVQDKNRRVLTAKTSTASIVYFSYDKQNFGEATNVGGAFSGSQKTGIKSHSDTDRDAILRGTPGVIEDAIDTIQVVKNVSNPSASFTITLFPTNNWKRMLKPGDWILVYLRNEELTQSNPDTKDCVIIGNLDRVSRVREKNEETDETTLRYKISGRNFGKVFEKTEIWFNPLTNQAKTTEVTLQTAGLPVTGSPDELTNTLLDIFLGDGGTTAGGSTTSPLGQWVIPSQLASYVGGSGSKFIDILDKSGIDGGLPGYKDRQMVGVGKGENLWESLKRASNQIVNEVFVEEARKDDYSVTPKFFLRPRPYNTVFFDSQFGGEDYKGELKGAHKTLQELARESFIEISSTEIIHEDLGFDEHSRFNMFWMEPRGYQSELKALPANVNTGSGVSLPMISKESIERHGLRRFDQVLDFAHTSAVDSKDSEAEYYLYKAFLVQIYDFYYANHLYEQGTIETTGVIEAELGSALIISDELNQGNDKVYYIEGYDHNFRYPNTWTTRFTLTRGQYLDGTRVFIDTTDDGDFGRKDKDIEQYLTKTEVKK